jgi:hypothetical protein
MTRLQREASSQSSHALSNSIRGDRAHDQTQNGSAEHQQANKDRAAMYVAAVISGDSVAQCETDKASSGNPCGDHTQHDYELF